ncbi:hypothetical protein BD410DRAFT_803785 [Rickenella mellea]|uniref:Uncharacterized protein n=1 Tax=Rickenella mellea TaxID=50990 RepID=A0A4Y7Q2S6_9AGAM|nr:hypothetical protein BD410DRAFT_803785 [Rickenella mellea]
MTKISSRDADALKQSAPPPTTIALGSSLPQTYNSLWGLLQIPVQQTSGSQLCLNISCPDTFNGKNSQVTKLAYSVRISGYVVLHQYIAWIARPDAPISDLGASDSLGLAFMFHATRLHISAPLGVPFRSQHLFSWCTGVVGDPVRVENGVVIRVLLIPVLNNGRVGNHSNRLSGSHERVDMLDICQLECSRRMNATGTGDVALGEMGCDKTRGTRDITHTELSIAQSLCVARKKLQLITAVLQTACDIRKRKDDMSPFFPAARVLRSSVSSDAVLELEPASDPNSYSPHLRESSLRTYGLTSFVDLMKVVKPLFPEKEKTDVVYAILKDGAKMEDNIQGDPVLCRPEFYGCSGALGGRKTPHPGTLKIFNTGWPRSQRSSLLTVQ